MKERLQMIADFVSILTTYPFWVQIFVGVWIVQTAILAAILIVKYDPPSDTPSIGEPANSGKLPIHPKKDTKMSERKLPTLKDPWTENTGDHNIDQVLAELNKLEVNGKSTPERRTEILRRLFLPNVFRHIQEERPLSATFRFAACEKILGHYQDFFYPDRVVHNAIGEARTRLIKLQQLISEAFGEYEFWAQNRFDESGLNLENFENSASGVLKPSAR